ncbi:MAG: hypothetical protein GC160_06170 [Acidobacteria bacterium]|nr:hypothetical protein [Acidobacteriota bacterium]
MSAAVLLLGGLTMFSRPAAAEASWNREAAARYLDARAATWTTEARTRRKLDTACISCHTAVPYLLSRALLSGFSEAKPAAELFADVESRVAGWTDNRAWYDHEADKVAQSQGAEAVLNALVLTARDRRAGRALSPQSRAALGYMWAQQKPAGDWDWLYFKLGPWETDGSNYWGAALAAVAALPVAGEAPPPEESLDRLRGYLRSGLDASTSLHNRLALLWAASAWRGLLSSAEVAAQVQQTLQGQQDDGGFRPETTPPWWPETGGDAYTTALAAFALQQVDDPRAAVAIARARLWLERNQQPDGRWNALSLNKDRSGEGDFTRLLMSDAATGFAVLALTSPVSTADAR